MAEARGKKYQYYQTRVLRVSETSVPLRNGARLPHTHTRRIETMRVLVIRTAMIGGGCSYDVYVPQEEIPANVRPRLSSWILRDSQALADYPEATLPPEHFDMPTGLARYSAWLEHERKARRAMLTIAERAYPELARLRPKTDTLPLLWTCGLLEHETSAETVLEV